MRGEALEEVLLFLLLRFDSLLALHHLLAQLEQFSRDGFAPAEGVREISPRSFQFLDSLAILSGEDPEDSAAGGRKSSWSRRSRSASTPCSGP
jgi:hypothetical protein